MQQVGCTSFSVAERQEPLFDSKADDRWNGPMQVQSTKNTTSCRDKLLLEVLETFDTRHRRDPLRPVRILRDNETNNCKGFQYEQHDRGPNLGHHGGETPTSRRRVQLPIRSGSSLALCCNFLTTYGSLFSIAYWLERNLMK